MGKNKQVVKITETDLHDIIKEAVNSVINEISIDTVDSAAKAAKKKYNSAHLKYGQNDPRTRRAMNQSLGFNKEVSKRYNKMNDAGRSRFLNNKEDRENGKRNYIKGKGWRTQ